jgi:hypothetical protein
MDSRRRELGLGLLALCGAASSSRISGAAPRMPAATAGTAVQALASGKPSAKSGLAFPLAPDPRA